MGNMGNLFDGDWYALWRTALILDKTSKYASLHKLIAMSTCETPSDYDNLYRSYFRREVSLGQMEGKDRLKEHVQKLIDEMK